MRVSFTPSSIQQRDMANHLFLTEQVRQYGRQCKTTEEQLATDANSFLTVSMYLCVGVRTYLYLSTFSPAYLCT